MRASREAGEGGDEGDIAIPPRSGDLRSEVRTRFFASTYLQKKPFQSENSVIFFRIHTRRMTKGIYPPFPPNAVKVPHLTGYHLSRPPPLFCLLSKKERNREGERMRMAAGTQLEKRRGLDTSAAQSFLRPPPGRRGDRHRTRCFFRTSDRSPIKRLFHSLRISTVWRCIGAALVGAVAGRGRA